MECGLLYVTILILMIIIGILSIIINRQRPQINIKNRQLQMLNDDLVKFHTERHNMTRLQSIERTGRMNSFTFIRNGETFTIESMGMMSDNITQWKMKAGLYDAV